jgi:single-stranded DNA-binding protein
MSASVLVTGTLFRAPESRVAKSGKSFVTATIKCRDGDRVEWWKICAFSESAGAELARLDDGDVVSVQGRLEVATYEQGGETRIRLSCIADHVLALRQPAKKRAPAATKAAAPKQPSAPDDRSLARHAGEGVDYFSDAIPF